MREIEVYSIENWGTRIADEYLDSLQNGLLRVEANPNLLFKETDFSSVLEFYRVRQHLFVCDRKPKSIVVLTVIHSSMDIQSRLNELVPTLSAEVEILHKRLR